VQADGCNRAGQVDRVIRLPDTLRDLSEVPPRQVAALMAEPRRLEPELDTPEDLGRS